MLNCNYFVRKNILLQPCIYDKPFPLDLTSPGCFGSFLEIISCFRKLILPGEYKFAFSCSGSARFVLHQQLYGMMRTLLVTASLFYTLLSAAQVFPPPDYQRGTFPDSSSIPLH